MTMIAERATADVHQIDAFHVLLPALARALDVREGFQQLSAVASRIVPHDEANLALATGDASQYRLYASTRHAAPDLWCRCDQCVLRDPIVPRLLDPVRGPERGLRSAVSAPVFARISSIGCRCSTSASRRFASAKPTFC